MTTRTPVFPESNISMMASSTGVVETKDPPNEDRRISSRDKKSTLIYVDGYAIKKENNYVVRGMQYVYHNTSSESLPNQPPKKRTKQSNPTKPKVPRVISPAETLRTEMKESMESAIRNKVQARDDFLYANLDALAPFIEPKVYQRIQSNHGASARHVGKDDATKEVFMQPDAITADMRDYQLAGLNFMSKMYQRNVGLILGDEMGLGKTLQTIALHCHICEAFQATGPSLIVCPLSVLYSWCDEIKKWAPTLKYLRYHSSNPDSMDSSDFQSYDLIVTTYEMIKAPSLRHMWYRHHFRLFVLDEGHRIKSADTQISQAVRKIHCENRMILTGTPLANNLVELYSLLSFLAPDVFTTTTPFAEAFDLTLNIVNPKRLEEAHKLLKVFMLRRLKSEVEKLMPRKIETKVVCPLSTMQIWWYKAILLKDMSLLARDDAGNRAKFLNNLVMQLRKCSIHPYLFPGAEDIDSTTLEDLVGASGKLAVLDMLLSSLYKKGHRVVLFSQFTSVLDILDDYCTMRGWNYCRFDGSTARAKRNFVVNSFNAPNSDKFLFLMSTRSGGMGLNLQTADTCILFDSDWNPQPDIQAMARVHRIGQKKTVHVYRLVTEGTVEQIMCERAEKKLYLDAMVTRDGVSGSDAFSDEENGGKLLETLKFGCNAVFGEGVNQNILPTDEDIAVITDRDRTEQYTAGKLKGGAEAVAGNYDGTRQFTSATNFAGIDFKKIRDEYSQSKKPKDIGEFGYIWEKKQRARKNRIKHIEAKDSGWGSKTVPVLNANDYDLETGERSVFNQELKGKATAHKKTKERDLFQNQDYCQVCGHEGALLKCSRCPASVHPNCAGVANKKEFLCCSHHHCSICRKSGSNAGGFLFPCNACSKCFCEDHLPNNVRYLDPCERVENLGYNVKNAVYVHCSTRCEMLATRKLGYRPPRNPQKVPCPPALDLTVYFGGEVDDNLEAPEEVVAGKRRRNKAHYAENRSPSDSSISGVRESTNLKGDDQCISENKENNNPVSFKQSDNYVILLD